jgi:hypothetical protein
MRQWSKFKIRQQFQKGFMYNFEEKAAVKNIYQFYKHTHTHTAIPDV